MKYILPIALFVFWHSLTAQVEDIEMGGFQRVIDYEQEVLPGMVLIKNAELPVGKDTVHVASFYVSACEETNGQYRAYLDFLKQYYSDATYRNALPDSTVWMGMTRYETSNDFLMLNYLTSEAYTDYPVIGLSPRQIQRYADWKTDRMNEYILVREGVIPELPLPKDSTEVFTTKGYVTGTWKPHHLTNFKGVHPVTDILVTRCRRMTMPEAMALSMELTEDRKASSPRSLNMDKYDKNKRFYYLRDIREGHKKQSQEVDMLTGLQAVYDTEKNAYGILGFGSNADELVNEQPVMLMKTGNEEGSFEMMTVQPNEHTRSGFRLAMDAIVQP